jgi:hypothetical protein
MNTQPPAKEHTYNVWGFRNKFHTFFGIVKGANQTLADKRAANLYGHGVWTTPRD